MTFAKVVACLLVLLAQPVRAEPPRPLLFIPGILGTKLCLGKEVVWGDRSSLQNLARLDLRKNLSVKPCGLVEQIRVLGPFWVMHEYDTLLDSLKQMGYVADKTLFIYPYDWRKSNFDTANDLTSYIDTHPELRDHPFDILAHSMGGLVARIYLTQHNGTAHVRKVIYLATPFFGAMNSLAMLSDGWGGFKNTIAGGIDAIRETILSFPSIFELMPTYPSCCRWGDPGSTNAFDLFDVDLWQKNQWLPTSFLSEAGLKAIRDGFKRATDIHAIVNAELNAHVDEIRMMGTAISTKLYLYVPEQERTWRTWIFRESGGGRNGPRVERGAQY